MGNNASVMRSASDFRAIKTLGKGGFGSAKLVIRKSDNKQFVLKQVDLTELRQKMEDNLKLMKDDIELARTKQERMAELEKVEAYRRLMEKVIEQTTTEHQKMMQFDHPNIVTVFASFEEDSIDPLNPGHCMYYLVMEFCECGDLDQAIRKAKDNNLPFTTVQIHRWASQLVSALRYLHAEGFVHRDIKPKNVFLVQNQEQCKLGDFGLAKETAKYKRVAQRIQSLTDIGTPLFCSPEFHSEPYTPKGDIWSLGVTLYNVANLNLPFHEVSQITSNESRLLPISDRYFDDLSDFIMAMLDKDPAKRPTAEQLGQYDFIAWPVLAEPKLSDDQKEEICVTLKAKKLRIDHLRSNFGEGDNDFDLKDPTSKAFVDGWRFDEWKKKFPETLLSLREAAIVGDVNQVKGILISPNVPPKGRRMLLEEKDKNGDNLLNNAVYYGRLDVVAFLLANFDNVIESRGFCGRTPLLKAAARGDLAVLKLLLGKGADLGVEDSALGSAAIHLAAEFGNTETVAYLLQQRPRWLEARGRRLGQTPLLHAACGGNLPVLKLLLEKGADLFARDGLRANNALHLAAFSGNVYVCSFLVTQNPSLLEQENGDGRRPIDVARLRSRRDVSLLLNSLA